MNAPVAVRSFNPKQEIVVSIAHILTSIVHLNKGGCMKTNKAWHEKMVSLVERMLESSPLFPQMPQRGASQGGS